ncbi:unnamed protein product [Rhizoctonia solani]|uniref:Uncharacterized protein n=1 Tax=Rhizoctonia solani TaxID=456999 RepID=A0A8H2WYQ6_9AGAM|nr:unnamed protein product [Rhizoctonia solani]
MDPEDSCPEAYLKGEAGSLVSVPEIASFSAVSSDSEKLEQMEQVASGSTGSLEVCPEFGSVTTRGSSVLSITPSNSPVTSSCEPPLTAATSIPPWEASQPSGGPPLKFGASPIAGYARSCHTVDSLDITRCRRASEATRAGPSNVFAPRACKYSAIRGLRNLGLRGLELFKKVKW